MANPDLSYIPERLIRKNRPVVQEFDNGERLYHRFINLMSVGAYQYPASVRFPDFSVNRSLFSEPEDVLLHDYPKCLNWGIAAFKVQDIPGDIVTGQVTGEVTTYSFKVVHDPLEYNYSHSEVRTEKNGVYSRELRIYNKRVKRRFRYHLSERIEILRHPNLP